MDRAVGRHRSPALDLVFYPLSSAADHGLLWIVLGAVREAAGRGPRGSALRLTAVLIAESSLTNGPVKLAFRRLRPVLEAGSTAPLPFGLRRPVTSAFPSGHATSGFTAASFLARDDPLGPAYFGLAGLVAFSRIYVRLHHASDVLAGIALGLLFGRLARRLVPPAGIRHDGELARALAGGNGSPAVDRWIGHDDPAGALRPADREDP